MDETLQIDVRKSALDLADDALYGSFLALARQIIGENAITLIAPNFAPFALQQATQLREDKRI